MAIYCEQTPYASETQLEDIYQKAYLPFMQNLEKHPQVKFAIYYSGFLLNWLSLRHPDFCELLKRLVKRGQVELLGSGFYDPILSLIPQKDAVVQILLSREYLNSNYGVYPRGIYLPQSIWEPHYPSLLADGEMEYTLLDDHSFRAAGMIKDDMRGYYISEDQGKADLAAQRTSALPTPSLSLRAEGESRRRGRLRDC